MSIEVPIKIDKKNSKFINIKIYYDKMKDVIFLSRCRVEDIPDKMKTRKIISNTIQLLSEMCISFHNNDKEVIIINLEEEHLVVDIISYIDDIDSTLDFICSDLTQVLDETKIRIVTYAISMLSKLYEDISEKLIAKTKTCKPCKKVKNVIEFVKNRRICKLCYNMTSNKSYIPVKKRPNAEPKDKAVKTKQKEVEEKPILRDMM